MSYPDYFSTKFENITFCTMILSRKVEGEKSLNYAKEKFCSNCLYKVCPEILFWLPDPSLLWIRIDVCTYRSFNNTFLNYKYEFFQWI